MKEGGTDICPLSHPFHYSIGPGMYMSPPVSFNFRKGLHSSPKSNLSGLRIDTFSLPTLIPLADSQLIFRNNMGCITV